MQTTPLRVVHFVHWPKSGITEVVRQIIMACKNDKIEYSIYLLTSDTDFDSYFQCCPSRFQFFYDKNKLAAIVRLLKAVRYIKPHILHCHSISPVLIACLLFRGKKIFHVHSEYPYLFDDGFYYRIKRLVFVGMHVLCRVSFICVSRRTTRRLRELGITHALFLPNCIEKNGLRKEITNEKPKFPVKVVSISRLHPEKNLLNCVEAIALLRERGYSVTYHIYGMGELQEALAAKIRELGLDEQVILAGYTFEPGRVLVDFDVYLSGSLYEGFGLSILQAMRAGIPIVSTDVGEIISSLRDGLELIKIPKFSPQAIADSLERYCNSTISEIYSITKNARLIFEQQYICDTLAKKMQNIYRCC